MPLRIGTSGWNYPAGKGTWNGVFYPLPEDRPRGFDELRFYSERFNTVEVNSTFYGQPRANATLAWATRTPPDFEFAVKLFQKFTHPNLSFDRGPVTQADVDAFRGGIDPLAAAWVQIDEPKFSSSVRQDLTGGNADFYYLRLHGRNAAQWWDHAEAEDRYNYVYSKEELEPIAAAVRDVMALARTRQPGALKKADLFLNNHFSAQAVANAVTLKPLLDEPVTARFPPELIDRFPDLAGIATLPRARLL